MWSVGEGVLWWNYCLFTKIVPANMFDKFRKYSWLQLFSHQNHKFDRMRNQEFQSFRVSFTHKKIRHLQWKVTQRKLLLQNHYKWQWFTYLFSFFIVLFLLLRTYQETKYVTWIKILHNAVQTAWNSGYFFTLDMWYSLSHFL